MSGRLIDARTGQPAAAGMAWVVRSPEGSLRVFRRFKRRRPALPIVLPEGWYLLWCPGCDYSVSFTRDDAATYDEWPAVVDAAVRHDCPARATEERA